MCALTRGRNYKVLIDHDWIGQDWGDGPVSAEVIAEQLRWALGACEYVIFFETYMTLAQVVGGPSLRVVSWQEYELDQIGAIGKKAFVLYHKASPRVLTYGLNRDLFEYSDLGDALDEIVAGIAYPRRFEPSPGGGGDQASRAPEAVEIEGGGLGEILRESHKTKSHAVGGICGPGQEQQVRGTSATGG